MSVRRRALLACALLAAVAAPAAGQVIGEVTAGRLSLACGAAITRRGALPRLDGSQMGRSRAGDR